MKAQQLPDGSLERSQKRKTRQYLKNAAIAVGCAVAVSVVLLYGRVGFFSGPALRDDAAPKEFFGDQGAAKEPGALDDQEAVGGQQEVLRAQFKERMNFYEHTSKPQIEALNLPGWARRQEQAALEASEREAIAAFAGGNFASALDQINRLIDRVSALQEKHETGFNRALQKAQQEFETDRFDQAVAAINQAFLYRPDSPSAARLHERISVMQDVAALVKAADVARVEGRLDREISLLSQAISLDSSRSDLVERHRSLSAKQQALNFDALVRAGWTALEQQHAEQAKTNLNKAARIFPDRRELGLLSAAIKKFEKERKYRFLINKAQTAQSNDDWASAVVHYTKALKIFPQAGRIMADLDMSNRIIHQTQHLESVLHQPQRLSDARAADNARQLVKESKQLAIQSPKLQQLAEQVTRAIEQVSAPVPVVVHSDNETHVSVLGIGVIGKVREYRLKEGLKPGSYTFKGERKGFQDKLVRVQVRQGEGVNVMVVCDEPI